MGGRFFIAQQRKRVPGRLVFVLLVAGVVAGASAVAQDGLLLLIEDWHLEHCTDTVDFDDDGDADYADLFQLANGWPAPATGTSTPVPTATPTPTVDPNAMIVMLPGDVPLVLQRIESGSFAMGANDNDGLWAWDWEKPSHTVQIGYEFYMGRHEVTIRQYAAFLRATGDESGVDWSDYDCPLVRSGGDYVLRGQFFGLDWDQPMVEVSWDGAVAFADWVSTLHEASFRLPSEAEWEYACRAGTDTKFSFGNSTCGERLCESCELDNYAVWCASRPGNHSATAATRLPNPWGLYDMHGNVMEWCADWYYAGYDGAPTDGSAWIDNGDVDSISRSCRGGCWSDKATGVRSASRDFFTPDFTYGSLGFRLVAQP